MFFRHQFILRASSRIPANLLIRQVTSRIRGPKFTGGGFGPDPEIPAAYIQPAAAVTAAGDIFFFVLQSGH